MLSTCSAQRSLLFPSHSSRPALKPDIFLNTQLVEKMFPSLSPWTTNGASVGNQYHQLMLRIMFSIFYFYFCPLSYDRDCSPRRLHNWWKALGRFSISALNFKTFWFNSDVGPVGLCSLTKLLLLFFKKRILYGTHYICLMFLRDCSPCMTLGREGQKSVEGAVSPKLWLCSLLILQQHQVLRTR